MLYLRPFSRESLLNVSTMCDSSFVHKSPEEQRASGVFYRAAAEQSHCAHRCDTTALGGEFHRIFLCGVQYLPMPAGFAMVYALFQHFDVPPRMSPFLRNPTNKCMMDQNSGQVISQVLRANCSWPPCTSGSCRDQLLCQEGEPQPSTARQAVTVSCPSCP